MRKLNKKKTLAVFKPSTVFLFSYKCFTINATWSTVITLMARSAWPHTIFWLFQSYFLLFIFSMLRNLTGGTVITKDIQENGDGRYVFVDEVMASALGEDPITLQA